MEHDHNAVSEIALRVLNLRACLISKGVLASLYHDFPVSLLASLYVAPAQACHDQQAARDQRHRRNFPTTYCGTA